MYALNLSFQFKILSIFILALKLHLRKTFCSILPVIMINDIELFSFVYQKQKIPPSCFLNLLSSPVPDK